MRGILYLVSLFLFCLGWFAGAAPELPLLSDSTTPRRGISLASYHAPGTSGKLYVTSSGVRLPTQSSSSQSPSPTYTPTPGDIDTEVTPPAAAPETYKVSADWHAFEDVAHGLTLFCPPEWLFFDGSQAATLQQDMAAMDRAEDVDLLTELRSSVQLSRLVAFGFAFTQNPP